MFTLYNMTKALEHYNLRKTKYASKCPNEETQRDFEELAQEPRNKGVEKSLFLLGSDDTFHWPETLAKQWIDYDLFVEGEKEATNQG